MSVGGISSEQALQAFLREKDLPSANRASRIYLKNDQLMYDADIGCMTLFAAKLGFGSAAMSNVSRFIKENKDDCLKDKNSITNYNTFIDSYNDKQSICWKKVKKIKQAVVKVFNPAPDFDYNKKENVYQLVKLHLGNCNALLNVDLEENFAELLDSCQTLSLSLESWIIEGKVSPEEKKTLDEILAFKNKARSIIFPAKEKPLKGTIGKFNPLISTSQEDKDTLHALLKDIRRATLTKYFHERLELDGLKLTELRTRFNENKGTLNEPQFLEAQLDRWQKKLDQGKPIAIPKWYHCTKQLDTLGKILDTHILYASMGYPGVFASNRPEVNGVGGYGDFCLAMGDHLEKVGTKEPGSGTVYPKYSKKNQSYTAPIQYSDVPLAPQDNALKNNQEGIQLWVGFQRGAHTLNPHTQYGTAGVPLERMERIKNGCLKYYKDTTLSFVFDIHDQAGTQKLGQQKRVQVITYAQEEALRSLINSTFHCTLPTEWQNKMTSF